MDMTTPFKVSISVDITFINDASITYHAFLGEREWDGGYWSGRFHDSEMIAIAEAMLDRYDDVIRMKADKITLGEISRNNGLAIQLLSVTETEPCEVMLNAELLILNEDD